MKVVIRSYSYKLQTCWNFFVSSFQFEHKLRTSFWRSKFLEKSAYKKYCEDVISPCDKNIFICFFFVFFTDLYVLVSESLVYLLYIFFPHISFCVQGLSFVCKTQNQFIYGAPIHRTLQTKSIQYNHTHIAIDSTDSRIDCNWSTVYNLNWFLKRFSKEIQ